MLYALLKIPAKFVLWIYARRLSIHPKAMLGVKGPALIACNHPNSFLDAIVIATLFKQPVFSLARGDAFGKKFYARLLRSMNMFPVYRVSEGVENLEHNYKTFDACKEVFKKNGIVLIFSEGRCINEWHLRPLKKGTARLAISSWQEGIPLKVIPAGINYSSFTTFGKNIILNFGTVIDADQVTWNMGEGKGLLDFNEKLRNQLKELVIEIPSEDRETVKKTFQVPQSPIKKILLFFPALLGFLLNAPLYLPVRYVARHGMKEPGHYDSVVMGMLFLLYPVYLALLSLLVACFFCGWWWLTVFVILPFCAWSYVQLKHQF
ncbi:MAG: 1-acyl-sn-glycerol-3-phosphate acyltransferase [Chitinophagaceae bacterium]|nr:1-acyl-sn-glycerol-3-phosphate acyltransferase [Chitinophagaceae bacterium]